MFTQKEFYLSNEDYEEIKKWAKNHKCIARHQDGRPSSSCCGGELTVCFTPTTIGDVVTVKCVCGEQIEIDRLG